MKNIERIIAVSGGKGGVGKSLFASTLALVLEKRRVKVGLFDLDFTSPSTHVILGVHDLQPKEEKGIVPPNFHGIEYMSMIYYSGSNSAPLRGADISNALMELLTIVTWGRLDFLILDMPPGISDVTLDLLRLVRNTEFLIVTTPSKLAFETVKKLTSLLQEMRTRVIGIVENMTTNKSGLIETETKKLGLTFLGRIPMDMEVEESLGKTDRLMATKFAKEVGLIASTIENC
jgi:ATP-binding protein involved in chromosome partitioning